MNWSDYSRFVGDVFGAPLAIEGLLAFFLESTFLGPVDLRLGPAAGQAAPGLHLAGRTSARCSRPTSSSPPTPGCSTRSATAYNPDTGRAELTDFGAVLINKVQLVTFPHVVARGVRDRRRLRGRRRAVAAAPRPPPTRTATMYRTAVRTRRRDRCWSPGIGVAVTGDLQGKVMTEVQPMKMAAAEALYETEAAGAASRSSPSARLDGTEETFADQGPRPAVVPGAPATSTARSRASTTCASEYEETYGQDPGAAYYSPGDYTPVIPLTYWTFRLMIGLGVARGRCRRLDPVGDPARADARAAGGCCGRRWRCRFLPLLGQLLRLDLHRDGPPAVGRLRADDHRPGRLARRQRRSRC